MASYFKVHSILQSGFFFLMYCEHIFKSLDIKSNLFVLIVV